MASILLKIALGTGVAYLTLGIFPDRLKGAIIAIATCIALAVILHFAAP